MRRVLISILLVLAAGCGDDDGVGGDAGLASDGGGAIDAAAMDAGAVDAGGEGTDAAVADAGASDAGETALDGGGEDAGAGPLDAGADAGSAVDAGSVRSVLVPQWCPGTNTAPGLYRGTLASSLNEIAGCDGSSAPGRDGAVRVLVEPGQTLTATYRHAGDGILYLLDSCPVTTSCLAESDSSISGAETITWTNTGAEANPVYVILDSDTLDNPQTFELDLFVTGP